MGRAEAACEVEIVPRLEVDPTDDPLMKRFQRIISRIGLPEVLEQPFRDRAPDRDVQPLLARRRDQP
ncbi:MAG TPA: hypothetical protein VKD72_24780 [Gemmataceae bacterium]|nr:hypothetical protein [Gemmataceae bacterium]